MEESIMSPPVRSPGIVGRAWSFVRVADFYGLWRAIERRRRLLQQIVSLPIGPGTFLMDPQAGIEGIGAREIEESISPASASLTELAVHLAPYRYALPFAEGEDVLEVGCNWGYGSHLLARRARTVTGFDIHRERVRHAEERFGGGNLSFLVHDANQPFPFADESFGLIFSSEVLEHLANFSGCVGEMHRGLRRGGGVLILKTPNLAYAKRWHSLNAYHRKVFLAHELRELCATYFEDVEISGFEEVPAHAIRHIAKSFDPFALAFEQKIPCPYTVELEGWIEARVVPVDRGVPQSLLAVCRGPRAADKIRGRYGR
jgi:2-polyprenyl-3-methyl-5-hydroxy-6-metoxy-1,4-benzoquinol methylase